MNVDAAMRQVAFAFFFFVTITQSLSIFVGLVFGNAGAFDWWFKFLCCTDQIILIFTCQCADSASEEVCVPRRACPKSKRHETNIYT